MQESKKGKDKPMIDNELKMHIALQSFYAKIKGEWQLGDMCKFLNNEIEFITHNLLCDLNDPDTFQDWKDNWLWLPRTIDTENPERGLDRFLTTKGIDFLFLHYQTLSDFLLDVNKTEWILKALIHQEDLRERL